MKTRDVAVCALLFSAAESYLLIKFAPQLRPVGGLGRLVERFTIVNLLLFTFYKIVVYPRVFSPLRHIPGPNDGKLLVGNGLDARFSHPRGDKIRQWIEKIPNEGILRFRDFLNKDAIVVTSHETLKQVLSDHSYDYQKQGRVRDILRSILGDGLILVEGSVHKFQRKHLLPSFQVKVIRDLYPVFWKKAVQMTKMLADEANSQKEIEMGIWCTRVTLDIIGIAGFGRDFDSLVNPEDDFVKQYNEVLEPDGEKALFFGLSLALPSWLVRNIPFWEIPARLNSISKNLYIFANNLSKERRAELNNPKISKEAKESRKDILSLLVKSNDFTDHELGEQVLTMMAAGHETTSSTLSWCLYLLAVNPDIQQRLRAEIRAALPSPDDASSESQISATVVDAMPLLNAVCNETLRLYPTVPVTTREVVKETSLAGQVMPVGTSIFISPWGINRSTKFWGADAMDFNPGRWIDLDKAGQEIPNNTGGASSNYSIMTFLHGPRSCIGQGFARSELKCLLAALVGRYDFTTTRDLSTYYSAGLVTTKPANGMWLNLKEVPGW